MGDRGRWWSSRNFEPYAQPNMKQHYLTVWLRQLGNLLQIWFGPLFPLLHWADGPIRDIKQVCSTQQAPPSLPTTIRWTPSQDRMRTAQFYHGILVPLLGTSVPSNGILRLWLRDSFLYGFYNGISTVPEVNIYYYNTTGPPRIPKSKRPLRNHR